MSEPETDESEILAYHHPDDPRYSFEFITDDRAQFVDEQETYEQRDGVATRTREEAVSGRTVYILYTRNTATSGIPDFDTDEEVRTWLNERFSRDDLAVILTVVDIFDGIREEKSDADDELYLYKQTELEQIPEVLGRVEWRQSVPAVGADLLSTFIRVHPMPNTNHRTGLGLLDRYLTSIDAGFEMPDTGEEGEWYSWAVDYIHDSKRLLTLRRNLATLRWAYQYGYRHVVRKEGVRINLEDVDIDRGSHFEYYTRQHQERTQEFIQSLLKVTDAAALQEQTDDGKQAFVQRLRGGQ